MSTREEEKERKRQIQGRAQDVTQRTNAGVVGLKTELYQAIID